jgi:hypothetical protein
MSSYVKHSFLTSPQHCGHPVADGATLVIPSRYVDLNEQVRTTDKFHAGVVAKLQRRQGMTMSDLQKYDILSNEDFSDPDSPWYTAPIIVPINRDRYNLIHSSAIRFAKVNNTCVLRWRCVDKSYEQRPQEQHMEEIYKNDPCFWEYFVAGAPCSINTTINKRLNLVNATKGTQFNLTMNSEAEQNDVDAALRLHPPGSVIDIPCPLAENISFDRRLFTSSQIRALKRYSIVGNDTFSSLMYVSQGSLDWLRENNVTNLEAESDSHSFAEEQEQMDTRNKEKDIVIPILRCLSRTRDRIHGYGTNHCDPFTVTLQQRFPIDSDFAITVNRSQGQTLDNVILAISHRDVSGCNFRYNGIYVAFSRVRERRCIRLLLVGDSIPKKWTSVSYIPNLKPDPFCWAVLSGWANLGGDDWQDDEWSPILTRRTYEASRVRKRSRRNGV